jgi:hypothetical protein
MLRDLAWNGNCRYNAELRGSAMRRNDMARKTLTSLVLLAAASPLFAASLQQPPPSVAPPGNPNTLYCMHVDPITGSNVQTIQCWTRAEWAEQDVDVDKEWAKNGVKIIG